MKRRNAGKIPFISLKDRSMTSGLQIFWPLAILLEICVFWDLTNHHAFLLMHEVGKVLSS
jgi:hypothetical protein